ncbi:DUF4252 domain-containing protein [Mangrovimonas sp. AS39]|uniref:DUF4252 domain-containing protein n=1 Tax=Mangrovimonas TaxID=1211036 RepID=UPI0014215363|nr:MULTISPECIES: DUF4252 domain-containing protein [Mangrovimonas]MCF1191927.1 DUF4252 domain-containing protein [Mangrovimonas futianensis]MCF1195621.1 DUF4252 domain-containing protein [Mangrovimonas futianensis]MCF1422406.1 DUF4252 domain-containing protein [Mangrovimonas futianensis]NIK92918.1 DUF4252 domain-containing protein [Mangrovimonas sp. CR14]
MKTKMILFLMAIMLLPLTSNAQDIFDKYSNSTDVTYVSIKPKMFQMLAKMNINTDDPEAQSYLDMVNSITSFKTIVTANQTISSDITKWVKGKLGSLEELMVVKDDGVEMKFFVKEGKDEDHVSELLMFVDGLNGITKDADININGKKREIETVVISLTGNIDLNQISKLTQQMNIPGGEHLEDNNKKK